MRILFHDLNDLNDLLSIPLTTPVGCIVVVVNVLRVMDDYSPPWSFGNN